MAAHWVYALAKQGARSCPAFNTFGAKRHSATVAGRLRNIGFRAHR
jgi:hypothetical protein